MEGAVSKKLRDNSEAITDKNNRHGKKNTETRQFTSASPSALAPYAHRFPKYLFSAGMEAMSHQALLPIAGRGGYLAGEDFTYLHLDLQASVPVFLKDLARHCAEKGVAELDIPIFETMPNHFTASFEPNLVCKFIVKKEMRLQCEYLAGFLQGTLETYSGHLYCVQRKCGVCSGGCDRCHLEVVRIEESDLCRRSAAEEIPENPDWEVKAI